MAQPALAAQSIPLAKISESPLNPRKIYDKAQLEDLAKSIKELGVLEPVLVRPVKGGHELVYGHRRFRAAKKAGLDAIPATIRELDDRQVLEIQVVENLQRADVTPIEEARGYVALVKEHQVPVREIAVRIGRTEAHVYQRMKLTELPKGIQDALERGELATSVALAIARIPDGKLQERAAEEVLKPERVWKAGMFVEEPMGATQALAFIRNRFTLKFAGADFDISDATLCPKAGACPTCPKRTVNQPLLFSDMAQEDLCTDPDCWEQKRQAGRARQLEEAAAKGKTVIPAEEAKKLFSAGGCVLGKEYFDLADCVGYDRDPKNRNWRQFLGKDLGALEVHVAADQAGILHELVRRKDALAALKKAGKLVKETSHADAGGSGANAKSDRKAKAFGIALQLTAAELVAAAEKKKPDRDFWAFLATALGESYMVNDVWKRRAVDYKNDRAKGQAIEAMGEAELRGLVLELVLGEDFDEWVTGFTPNVEAAAKLLKVDLKKILKAAEAQLEVQEKKAKEPEPEKAPDPKPDKKKAAKKGGGKR